MLNLKRLPSNVIQAIKETVGALVLINFALALAAFFKDVFLSSYVGTSAYSDALALAYFIPDMIGNNLFAFAIGVSCVPVFSKLYVQGDKARFSSLIRNATVYFVFFAFVVTGILIIFHQEVLIFLAGETSFKLYHITLPLYLILLPTFIIFPMIAIGTALLQTMNRFKSAVLPTLLNNVLYLAALIFCILAGVRQEQGVYLIAGFIAAGVVATFILIEWFIVRERTVWNAQSSSRIFAPTAIERADLQDILSKLMPFMLILLSTQSVYIVERYLAARLPTGTIAALNYAFRLSQFPIWIFVAAVSTVVLPAIAKYIEMQKLAELRGILLRAIRNVVLVTLPMSIFLYVFREPIVSILFQRGAFDVESVAVTSDILAGYSLSIAGQAVSALCLRYFMAKGYMLQSLAIYFFTGAVTIVLDMYWVPLIGATGLGYGAAVGALLNAIMLIRLLKKKLGWNWSSYFDKILKIGICNLVLFFIMEIGSFLDQKHFMIDTHVQHFVLLVIVALISAIVYALGLLKLRIL